jgi:GNAT superfamily N-acetyltransferase
MEEDETVSHVIYRPATEADLPAAVAVYETARNAMLTRQRLPAPPLDPEGALRGYRHVLTTGIFRVAEVDGDLAGVCLAIVRDGLWFLSGFWVRPDMKGQGLGGPLLRQVWDEGARAGAHTYFVWSSTDVTAMAAYLKRGMLPGYPLLKFSGPVTRPPAIPPGYTAEPLALTTAVALDQMVLGTGREVDHRYWLSQAGTRGFQVRAGSQVVGYFYVGPRHNLGPVAWSAPGFGTGVLALALAEAGAGEQPVSLTVPGINHGALQVTLDAGLRLDGFSHFLTTSRFGKPEQYLPSGALLY